MAIYHGTFDKQKKSFTFENVPNGKYIAVVDYTTEYGDKFNISRGSVTVKGGVNVSADMVIDKSGITYPVTGVELSSSTAEMFVIDTEGLQLTSTVIPAKASNKAVTWESSNTSVATVDQTGKVIPVSVGSTTITVKTADGNKTATCVVTILPISVTGVTLDQNSISIRIDEENGITLIATVSPNNATNKNVTWASSNTDVVVVNSSGKVIPTGVGSAEVTVTTADGSKTATCAVTVTPVPVTGVTLDKTSHTVDYANLSAGNTVTLKATVSPSNATNKKVSWKSSNTGVATVDSAGKVTIKDIGTATITVTTEDGSKTATCAVKCNGLEVRTGNISTTDSTVITTLDGFSAAMVERDTYMDYQIENGWSEPPYEWTGFFSRGELSSDKKYFTFRDLKPNDNLCDILLYKSGVYCGQNYDGTGAGFTISSSTPVIPVRIIMKNYPG